MGGYRLNTDFKEEKFDLGRMFGFAYGEKENGAVFSHMTVMYANALYQRGFVKEGYRALYTLLEQAKRFWTLPWILRTAGCILEFRNILMRTEKANIRI